VSFFDYDRTGIYPAFILDNLRELLTTPADDPRLSLLSPSRHGLADHSAARFQHRPFS